MTSNLNLSGFRVNLFENLNFRAVCQIQIFEIIAVLLCDEHDDGLIVVHYFESKFCSFL